MKIHRVVQMLGATTSTGKLADDMYDLNYKDYYSEAQDRYIPISHMDFQHLVRAFVKQNEEDVRTDTQEGKIRDQAIFYDDVVEKNDRIYKKNIEELQLENVRLVAQLEHDEHQVGKYEELREKYHVLFDAHNVETNRDTIWQERYEEELKNSEYWKAQYRIANDLLQPKGCGYTFSEIPNDTDGQEFVDTMKKYFNKKSYKMRVRGQHIKPELRGTGATYHGQNLNESTHMRIYIEVK